MSDAVIVALLALIGNIIVSYFSHQKATAVVAYRIEQLETKVNKHNEVIERTYNLETKEKLINKDLTNIHETLERLEGYHRA